MEIDSALASAIASGVTTIAVLVIGRMFSRRMDSAQAKSSEGDAAKALSDAAKTQISTYNEEVVSPLRGRIDGLERENSSLREVLSDVNGKAEASRRAYAEQVESLQVKIKDLTRSVENQRNQIVILIEQSESKDRTIQRMQEEIGQLQRENESLREKIDKLQSENDILKTQPVG